MRAALPLMRTRLDHRTPELLFAVDAMGASDADAGGFGVVATEAEPSEVREVFATARVLSYTVPRLSGDLSGLRRPEKILTRTVPLSLLPDAVLEAERWTTLDRGRWAIADHNTLGEARTVIKLLRRLATVSHWHRTLIIALEDNQPVCGSFTKGRSPTPHLNRLCRQKSAAILAMNARLVLPWVETARQPADHDSRIVRAPMARR